jgi:DNA primase
VALKYRDIKQKEFFEASKDYASSRLGIIFRGGDRAYCPFHKDSQDSFRAYIHENSDVRFHCFGACGGDWDIFDLIMKVEKCGFGEAQERFAKFLGLEIEKYNKSNEYQQLVDEKDQQEQTEPVVETSKKEVTEEHRQVMQDAAGFYNQMLLSNPERFEKIIKYLKKRGVGNEAIRKFRIGYCPSFHEADYKGRAFLQHIRPQLDEDYLQFWPYYQSSLIRLLDDETSPGFRYYQGQIDYTTSVWGRYADYFTGRITFPVYGVDGQIQGIVGRRPDNRGYRWMRQAGGDTLIDQKGWLYGIDKAARGIREYQTVIVVEGVFDFFAFYNISENPDRPIVVSSLGARLDSDAIKLLQRLGVKYFILAFDCDEAGHKGIRNAIENIRAGKISYLGSLKEGEDPAERLKGVTGGLSNFGIRHLQKGMEIESPSGKPVMASVLVQRQQGKNTFSDEVLIKPAQAMKPSESSGSEKTSGSLWYRVFDILPLLTYDHGNRAELDRKLHLVRSILDSPAKQEPEAKDGWFALPIKFIENETHVKLEAALIMHMRLAIEQQHRQRRIKISDSELAEWLHTSRKTVQKYKAELRKSGLLNSEIKGVQQSLSVRYFSKEGDPPVPTSID